MALWQKTLAPSSEHKGGVGSFLKIPRSNSDNGCRTEVSRIYLFLFELKEILTFISIFYNFYDIFNSIHRLEIIIFQLLNLKNNF